VDKTKLLVCQESNPDSSMVLLEESDLFTLNTVTFKLRRWSRVGGVNAVRIRFKMLGILLTSYV
jgi:hypothetical protein